MMSKFWQNWFSAWAVAVTLFGVVLAAGAFPATDGLLRALVSLFGNPLPAVPDAHHRFAYGLMGAVSLGWGLTYFITFKALFALPPVQAASLWRYVLFAALAWYSIDSYISVVTGFWMNAISNTLLIGLLLIGLTQSGVLSEGSGKPAAA
jgi:hypothetical protein